MCLQPGVQQLRGISNNSSLKVDSRDCHLSRFASFEQIHDVKVPLYAREKKNGPFSVRTSTNLLREDCCQFFQFVEISMGISNTLIIGS